MVKKRTKTPTARALEEIRKQGFVAEVVERRLPHCFVTKDFFGFADIIYATESSIVALQVTGGKNHASRKTKILAEPKALVWLKAGGLIELWTYNKQGPRGQVKTWVCRKEEIVKSDFIVPWEEEVA